MELLFVLAVFVALAVAKSPEGKYLFRTLEINLQSGECDLLLALLCVCEFV